MTDHDLLAAISELLDNKLQPIKDELEAVEKNVEHLKKETIKMQAMDEAILDEIEGVHDILDKQKSDKSVHTA